MNKTIENIVRDIEKLPDLMVVKSEVLAIIRGEVSKIVQPQISSNNVTIFPKSRTVVDSNSGKSTILTKKEFDLLYYLMSHPNEYLTRFDILNDVWGNDVTIDEKTITVYINKLRTLFNPKFIATSKGVGYKWDGLYFRRLERNAI